MIIAVLAGYALSRYYRKRIVKASNFMMMLSQMIPGVLLLVPLYMIMQQMHMLETHISLVLAYTTFVIPLCTFMMSSFFDTVPIDLEEAAEIDGCSKAKTLIRVILPVSIPSLISTGLYAFINAWNEFMFGYVLISSDKLRTLTPAIMLFKGANLVDWGGLMGGIRHFGPAGYDHFPVPSEILPCRSDERFGQGLMEVCHEAYRNQRKRYPYGL